MVSADLIFTAPDGLHARPAGELVKLVKGFAGTTVTLTSGQRSVSAASMLSVLSLGVKNGTAITVSADGPDEQAALDAVLTLLNAVS